MTLKSQTALTGAAASAAVAGATILLGEVGSAWLDTSYHPLPYQPVFTGLAFLALALLLRALAGPVGRGR